MKRKGIDMSDTKTGKTETVSDVLAKARERNDGASTLLDKLEEIAGNAEQIAGYACYHDGQDRWAADWPDYLAGVDRVAERIVSGQIRMDDWGHPTYPLYQALCDEVTPECSMMGSYARPVEFIAGFARDEILAEDDLAALAEWFGVEVWL